MTTAMPPLPEGFKNMISKMPQVDASSFFSALEGAPSVGVRLNPRKPGAESLPALQPLTDRVPWNDLGFYLAERPRFTLMPEFHQGLFYVQDPSSMIHSRLVGEIVKKIGKEDGFRLLDLCAAPGGKTTAAIDALPKGSLVVANEFVASRAYILAENLSKWGYPDVIVTSGDTKAFRKIREKFDIVIADVPCSGEGMMRKESVARTQWSPALIAQCAELQREILTNAAEALAPGGYLIYSTCTFNLDEDERQVKWMCEEFGMENVSLDHIAGSLGIAGSFAEGVSALRFLPDITRGEGLFVTVMRKNGEGKTEVAGKNKKTGKEKALPGTDKFIIPEGYVVIERGEDIWAIREIHKKTLSAIEKETKVIKGGVGLGTVKGKDIIVGQDVALTPGFDLKGCPELPVNRETALRFLAREAMPGCPELPKGFVKLTFGGYPLGWIKNLGNRANNLYPAEWRVRNLGNIE